MRTQITPIWPVMFAGFLVTGIYYVAASLIFPDSEEEGHEAHFAANYQLGLAGVLICNAALFGCEASIVGAENLFSFRQMVISWALWPVGIVAIFARDRRVVLGRIVWLIALYPLSLFWT